MFEASSHFCRKFRGKTSFLSLEVLEVAVLKEVSQKTSLFSLQTALCCFLMFQVKCSKMFKGCFAEKFGFQPSNLKAKSIECQIH